MADQTIDPAALADAVEKLQSYTFRPGIESTLFRLKGSEVAALLAVAASTEAEPETITVKLSTENQASIRRLVQNEVARLNSMLYGLSDEASDRARLQPEIDRLTALYSELVS